MLYKTTLSIELVNVFLSNVVNRTTCHWLKNLAIDDNINYDQAKTLNVSADHIYFGTTLKIRVKLTPHYPQAYAITFT